MVIEQRSQKARWLACVVAACVFPGLSCWRYSTPLGLDRLPSLRARGASYKSMADACAVRREQASGGLNVGI